MMAELTYLIKYGPADFISEKAKLLYYILKPFSKKIINDRLLITKEFDKKLSQTKHKTIIELGVGYSLRGYNYALKNPNKQVIEYDLPKVIAKKKSFLKIPKNMSLLSLDFTKENMLPFDNSLILAEGFTSYLTKEEYESLLQTIIKFKNSEFFTQESLKNNFGLIRILLSVFGKPHRKFKNFEDMKVFFPKFNYYKKKNFYFISV